MKRDSSMKGVTQSEGNRKFKLLSSSMQFLSDFLSSEEVEEVEKGLSSSAASAAILEPWAFFFRKALRASTASLLMPSSSSMSMHSTRGRST